jgi:hypothetical protein
MRCRGASRCCSVIPVSRVRTLSLSLSLIYASRARALSLSLSVHDRASHVTRFHTHAQQSPPYGTQSLIHVEWERGRPLKNGSTSSVWPLRLPHSEDRWPEYLACARALARSHARTLIDRMLLIIHVGFVLEKEEDMNNLFQDIANEQRWDGHHSWQGSYLGSSITINLRHNFSNKSSLHTFHSKN